MLSSLFRRRPRAVREADRVWPTQRARLRGVLDTPGARVLAHFPETARALQSLARADGRAIEITLAGQLVPAAQPERALMVVVAERHPLREHDERVAAWADAAADRIVFHVSLEDPLLALFVGDSLRSLLERLGLSPDAPLESPAVSRAIENAQAKVRKRASSDVPTDSAAAWFEANGFAGTGWR